MDSPTDMEFLLGVLRCPRSGQKLREEGGRLLSEDGKHAYRVIDRIPVLLPEEAVEVLL
ncbi:MAG: hypothetical protein WCI38_03100 [Chthoniobacterales bacterium]